MSILKKIFIVSQHYIQLQKLLFVESHKQATGSNGFYSATLKIIIKTIFRFFFNDCTLQSLTFCKQFGNLKIFNNIKK